MCWRAAKITENGTSMNLVPESFYKPHFNSCLEVKQCVASSVLMWLQRFNNWGFVVNINDIAGVVFFHTCGWSHVSVPVDFHNE